MIRDLGSESGVEEYSLQNQHDHRRGGVRKNDLRSSVSMIFINKVAKSKALALPYYMLKAYDAQISKTNRSLNHINRSIINSNTKV